MADMHMDAFAVLFRHLQLDALPYISYKHAKDAGTALATREWVFHTTKRGRRHNEINHVKQIAMFRNINKAAHDTQQPRDALLQLHTHFQEYLDMFHHTTPVPFHLTDDSSINVGIMWPPMIRDIQRYAAIRWALESPSFSTPLLIEPGHPLFPEVRTSEPMNNPAFRDRTEGRGVVERLALALYCQLRFDGGNTARQVANRSMLEEFVLSGAFRVVIELMRSYPTNESIQVYLCFFLSIFFQYAEMFLVLKFASAENIFHELFATVRYKQTREYIKSVNPVVSRTICNAVKRFPYIMNMRHLRHLGRYMTSEDKTSCNWNVCTWYDA